MAKKKISYIRYGIAEWYGRPFHLLTIDEQKNFALARKSTDFHCPFRSNEKKIIPCNKAGGVCSFRPYHYDVNSGLVSFPLTESPIVTMCPQRFKERDLIFRWVSSTILGNDAPWIVREVGFLIREENQPIADPALDNAVQEVEAEDVGQIDYVLAREANLRLDWCALELQAVYFSGKSMSTEFAQIRDWIGEGLPFPINTRRPDYRSSGPKRLMPQLQIKVPTLRRWGKKMAVVVDQNFFNALGKMDFASDISNSDIVWFVVDYQEDETGITLQPVHAFFTTLERAVEGLTAGRPVSLPQFEQRIREKINRA